jgi:serine/threonine protein kinase
LLSPGDIVDRYQVEAIIGSGGTAIVYRVRHRQLNTAHALKVLSVTSNTIRERMIREGQVQAALRHLNVVAVTDVLDIAGAPGLLLEYIEGPSLEDALRKYRLTVADGELLFQGILAGVRHAHHHGLVHRDLKPANVLLAKTAEGYVPKVTDFGLAKVLQTDAEGQTGSTRNGIAMGTPHYMAPEQIRDARNVDQRADVFSLGCILYELCTGGRTFPGDEALAIYNAIIAGEYVRPRDVVPDLPQRLDLAIRGALLIDPKRRIPDCDTLGSVIKGELAWDAAETSRPGSNSAERRTPVPAPNTAAPVLPVAQREPDGSTPPPTPDRVQAPVTAAKSRTSGGMGSGGAMGTGSAVALGAELNEPVRPPLDSNEMSITRRAPIRRKESTPTDVTLGAGDSPTPIPSSGDPGPGTNPLWLIALVGGIVLGGLFALTVVAMLALILAFGVASPPDDAAPTIVPASAPAVVPATPPTPPIDVPPPVIATPPTPPTPPTTTTTTHEPRPPRPPASTTPAPHVVAPPVTTTAPPVTAPSVATLKILSVPPTASVVIDGATRTPTPLKLEIAPGKHEVEVRSGDQVGRFTVEALAGVDNKWCYAFADGSVHAGVCPK